MNLVNADLAVVDSAKVRDCLLSAILIGPSGRSATVRTVWILRPEEQFPRFVTALPR